MAKLDQLRGDSMNVVSLFSGVGGFDLGLEQAGMKTIYQCEWDKHATNILQRHWPHVPKWGDITTLTAQEILRHGQKPDVIAWGSPCQDLSVAGKRAGLEGERSGLFHEGMRIIKELRKETNNAYPRISIWENVAGALSSNRGADFGIILDEMAEAGAMVIEWAMLDAQHFGIPQRRRRVFVIAIFDPAIATNCPNPLLPVSQSLRGDTKKGKPKGQAVASETSAGFGSGSFGGWTETDTAITLSARDHKSSNTIVGSLAARDYKGVGSQYVDEGKVIVEPFVKSRRAQTSDDDETWVEGEINPTLNSFDTGDTRSTTAIVTNEVVKDPVGTLQARVAATNHESIRDGHAIITETHLLDGTRVNDVRIYEPPVQTLQARMGTGGNNVPMLSEPMMAVRRLTPLECERLMGWSDDHTRYKADGTEQADTHRYKQCGNGVASPVAKWIAQHILNIPKDPAQ
jgi:DNA (cytosine-5)-methyltransferase 1